MVPSTGRIAAGFPIVGIGAAAGGLAAFQQFLKALPDDSGLALVLIPHGDPQHESPMVDMLSSQTWMPVVEAEDGLTVEVNHVYVISPSNVLIISDGVFQRFDRPPQQVRPTAIDCFLKSLAKAQREQAIGIVLSGTGSHGTAGIREIKLTGGKVLVQSPASAGYDQMPRNAIATGLADCILPPDQMATALVQFIDQPYLIRSQEKSAATPEELKQLDRILGVLRRRTRYDFRSYRKPMIMRRVLRRMGLCHVAALQEYLALLQERADEVVALYKDLLIGVTGFFRDPAAYEVLKKELIPALIARQTDQFPTRVWLPGCATGEEAYSIAMLLFEGFAAADLPYNAQIFASDVDEDSIATARRGIYSAGVVGDVSVERIQQFFVAVDDQHFQVTKQLRESIVFSRQNLLCDPPFSKLDLISCRNFLNYLEPVIRQQVISLFHFALTEDGFLMLGPSDAMDKAADRFAPVSKKWGLFRRIGSQRPELLELPLGDSRPRLPAVTSLSLAAGPPKSSRKMAEELVLKEFSPAIVLINRGYEILDVAGPLTNYLEVSGGELSQDLLTMAKLGLRTKLRAICRRSDRSKSPVKDCDARVKRDGRYVRCSIAVRPLTAPNQTEGLMLVTFEDYASDLSQSNGAGMHLPIPDGIPSTLADSMFVGGAPLVEQRDFESNSSREEMQRTIDQLANANEALRASNEEIMSMSEEFQSANEELECSREELKFLNEQLITVNNQLEAKIAEVDKANADITNLMASTAIATIFLNKELRIVRFTPAVVQLFKLFPTDMGRPLADIAHPFLDRSLEQECQHVLANLIPIEREVQTDASRYYLRRILPYRTYDDRIGGVVITFLDLTDRVAAERQSRLLSIALRDSNDAVSVQAIDGSITLWNRGAERMYGYSESEALTMNARELVPQGHTDEVLAAVQRVAGGGASESFETRQCAKDGRELDVWMTVSKGMDGAETKVVTTHQDITMRKRSERRLQESEERMRAILETAPDAIITVHHDGVIDSINPAAEELFGYSHDELIGRDFSTFILSAAADDHEDFVRRFLQKREGRLTDNRHEAMAVRQDGSTFHVDISISQVDGLALFTAVIRDITARKNLETRVLEIATDEQRRIGQELHDGTQQELTALSLMAGTMLSVLNSASRPEPPSNQHDGRVTWRLDDEPFLQVQQTGSRLAKGLSEASRHVHELSHGILPVQVDSEGLRSALTNLAETTDLQHAIRCSFACSGAIAVANPTVGAQLYRIAQEALNNALRHGAASEVRILLCQRADALVLEVRDNGHGFDADTFNARASKSLGMGLQIMEHRAKSIRGTLRFHRGEDGGAIVQCTVPTEGLADV